LIKGLLKRGGSSKQCERNVAQLDAVAIRKLVSQISGHVITPETPDYESARLFSTAHLIGARRRSFAVPGAPKPNGITFEQAAAVPTSGSIALLNLRRGG
jgi:NADPH:quinone reductase-like Zn-dependent oxidoreductase